MFPDDTISLRHLPRRSSKNCDLQFANNDRFKANYSIDGKDNMFSALLLGIVDNLMQQLQFNTTSRQPLNGVSSKKSTHFVDGDDKFASSDAALKSRCCFTE